MQQIDETRSRFTRNGGLDLHYLDSGDDPAGGTPVVFVPGFGEVSGDHVDLVEHLAPRRVVVPDLRGRGLSASAPAGCWSPEHHHSDLAAIIEAAGLDRFHLAAYSRGCSYALGWVFAHPGRIVSLVLAEYPAREVRMQLPEETADYLSTKGMRFGTPITDRIAADDIRSIFEESGDHSYYAELAALSEPLLLLAGDRRGRVLGDTARAAYAEARPDATLEIYDTAHDLWEGDDRRVAERLRRWFDEVDGGA